MPTAPTALPTALRTALRVALSAAIDSAVWVRRDAKPRNYDPNAVALLDVRETAREPGPDGTAWVTYTARFAYRRNAEVRPPSPARLDSLDDKRRACVAALHRLALPGVPEVRDYRELPDPDISWPNGSADGFALAAEYECQES